jgi:hypothetical protein
MEHYAFPPARGYRLNRLLFLLKSDDGFRERFRADAARALDELGLDAETRGAVQAFDRDRLLALGAHAYLVFMAALRLRMENDPGAFEYF